MVCLTALLGCSGNRSGQPAPIYGEPVTDPYASAVKPTSSSNTTKGTVIKPLPPEQSVPMEAIEAPLSPAPAAQFSPAVVALMAESERSSRSGDYESAAAVLERALRIDPRNPELTYKLAELKLQQEKPRLAEDLAKKAELLAGRQRELKHKSWLLISRARQMQGLYDGAKEAQSKADQFADQ